MNGASEEATKGGWEGDRLREGIQAEEEGQGNDDGVVIPRIFVNNGAACVTHTPPHSHSFTPLSLGGDR